MEKCCEAVLWRSVVKECCGEVLHKCCEGVLWQIVVEKCSREGRHCRQVHSYLTTTGPSQFNV